MKKQSLNLKNYILHLDNWIPQNVLDDCLKKLKKNKTWERHTYTNIRSEEHTSELQSRLHLVCRLLLEKKNEKHINLN